MNNFIQMSIQAARSQCEFVSKIIAHVYRQQTLNHELCEPHNVSIDTLGLF